MFPVLHTEILSVSKSSEQSNEHKLSLLSSLLDAASAYVASVSAALQILICSFTVIRVNIFEIL